VEEYSCTFQALISNWRQRWSDFSHSDPDLPFGFVQIGSYRGYNGYEFPLVRWHQTADIGYVPNDERQNAFMAVALDTHDADGDAIMPRDKKVVPSP